MLDLTIAEARARLSAYVAHESDVDAADFETRLDDLVNAVLHDTATSLSSCAECGHPETQHSEGDDPVTPGECADCLDDSPDDARHDYQKGA